MERFTILRHRCAAPLLLLSTFVLATGSAAAQGLFDAPEYYEAGASPSDVACADLNGDHHTDLVVANKSSGTVSVFFNDGSGAFAAAATYGVGGSTLAVIIAEMDEDAYPDILTSCEGTNQVAVLINDGDGTFGSAVSYAVGQAPWGLIAADLDGDQDADVAVVNRDSRTVSLLLNNGDGTLSSNGSFSASGAYIKPGWLESGDIDGDGDVDLVVTKNYHNLYFNAGYAQVFVNNGAGDFTSAATHDLGRTVTTPLLADLDGDQDLDLAVSGFVDSSYKLSVLLNDGNGHFLDPVAYYAAASGRAAGGDFDNDGDYDVLISKEGVGSGSFSVLRNHGDATFADAFTVAVGPYPMGLTGGDFDSDDDLDVAVAIQGDNQVAVTMNLTDPPLSDVTDSRHGLGSGSSLLYQNSPNPFGASTVVRYDLARPEDVNLAIFDLSGRRVRVLAEGLRGPGVGEASWDGRDERGRAVPNGIYFARLAAGSNAAWREVVVLR